MKVAVVGSGISGLGAAWLLNRKHDVHVFEKRSRLGGHTHTVVHDLDGRDLPLDTGFIVFNEKTYPLLTRLFDELSVEAQTSEMSFSVSCLDPDIEYASHSLSGLFAKRSLLLSAAYLKMLVDVVRFGRRGRQILAATGDPGVTIAEFLEDERFSENFARFYLMPMVSAIWLSGTELAADYPRDPLLRFLDNHGLLQVTGQPNWRTVVGGSHSYIAPLTRPLDDRVQIKVVDYRDFDGDFHAVISIEMLEAVGHRFFDGFFTTCDRVLRPGGRMALQTITIPDQVYDRYRRGTDWIRAYIFPGGHLPSLGAIQGSLARRTGLVIDRLDDMADHYAATLKAWRTRFWSQEERVRALGFDDRFMRMWDFYLATCEAAFRDRQIGVLQMSLARSGRRVR